MPLGPQPRRARGTIGHPYSALNLRFLLAAFGLVVSAVFAGLLFWAGYTAAGVVMAGVAVIALVNMVVVEQRRRARRRRGEASTSLFE
jgi:membrane protein YdbS with pleckstrin-like domain